MMDIERSRIAGMLQALFDEYGLDYRNYAYSTLYRRIRHRMIVEKICDLQQFCMKVLEDEELRERLVSDFSLVVTLMYRDPGFYQLFRKRVVPWLQELPFIRIWHAGCATGEEALSMAILLHEERVLERCRIYATDINELALAKARCGSVDMASMQIYTRNYIQSGGAEEFSRYYTIRGHEAHFNEEFVSRIVFAKHNLATDHRFNRFHVIICRNVLIYFNQFLQDRVHGLFVESLLEQGFLGLGNKESMLVSSLADHYETIDHDHKLFRRKEELNC